MSVKDEHLDENFIERSFTVTDNFLENGILAIDYRLRQLVSFFKDYEEIELVTGKHYLKGIYRRSNSYILALELKVLCQKLGYSIGDTLVFRKYGKDFRRFYVQFEGKSQERVDELTEGLSSWRMPELHVKYPKVSEGELQKRIQNVFDQASSDFISKEDALNGLIDFQLTGELYQKELISLNKVQNVFHYPHQIEAVRKVILECRGRALLADEVGLGKTIEAGLILREYFERGEIQRCFVVVPASLTAQWQGELKQKFGFEFEIITNPSEVEKTPFAIMSLDTAKGQKYRQLFSQLHFDLVIVDEAHKLKNKKTQNYQFVKGLCAKYMLLLTATPIQNDLVELFNLIYLIAPGSLGTMQKFKKQYIHPVNKRLPLNVDTLKRRLAPFMIRNNRALTQLKLPPRRVVFKQVELGELERVVYNKLTSFIRSYYYVVSSKKQFLNQLTLMLFQKLITSSPMALADSMQNMVVKGGLDTEVEKSFLEMIDICSKVKSPAKFEVVRDLLTNELADEKVLIFTQFRTTQRQLRAYLKEAGIDPILFNGEMTLKKKDQAIEDFRNEKRVLISTDSGAEGRNVQFARYMINFDFPWNPMKVEQRIGRIHRLGQKYETFILNLCTVNTIEEHIVELLSKKIRLFERIVGELEMILGYLASDLKELESLDKKIMDIVVKYESQDDQAQMLDALGKKFAKAAEVYEEVSRSQEYVFGA
jgi:SNF2 family DNA or RNA helicase